uniref:Peptidase A1 domain-containing protein n=1 Tax=Leersia perrieri TaxID=77586 RepID=A0A0D9WU78_9ORYZ
MPPHSFLLAVAAAFLAVAIITGDEVSVSGLSLDIHHRYSPVVQRWAEARGHAGISWPAAAGDGQLVLRSPEYYSTLSLHDHALFSRRGLAQSDPLTFADGNATFQLVGSLHYAAVSVGTPNTTFLVALDTGSDLFWVPCDCKQCANVTAAMAAGDNSQLFRQYSPSKSSTSKKVTCENPLCVTPNACSNSTTSCPYAVNYVSANTSSSGDLVEDVIYLTGAGGDTGVKAAPVVFGCGQIQTGLFLEGAAADGLLGLGIEKVSVPSILAANGVVKSDSFSMCFSSDGVGRINFGDTGAANQAQTPYIVRPTHPFYNISVTSMSVGGKELPVGFYAVVDSGTSFTYLSGPAYTALTTNFNAQVREKRINITSARSRSGSLPFDYCYELKSDQTDLLVPEVNLTTKGGAVFPVTDPIVVVVGRLPNGQARALGYCLAVIKSDLPIDIIGQNFMTGLKVVFNREKSVLGWQEFDCYKDVKMSDAGGVGSPSPSPGPTTHINPQPQVNDGNGQIPGAAPLPRPNSAAGHAVSGGVVFFSMMMLAAAIF